METLRNWGTEFACFGYIERILDANTECSSSVYLHSQVLTLVYYWMCWVTVRVKESENGRFVRFWKRTVRWCTFSCNTCDKAATLLGVSRASVSKVMSVYTNQGKTTSAKGAVGENRHWQKEFVVHWERLFRKITQLLQDGRTEYSSWKPYSTRTVRRELHKSSINGRALIDKILIIESNTKMSRGWCQDYKTWTSENRTTGNARVIWSDESFFTLLPTTGRFYVWRIPKEAYNPECLVKTVKYGGDSVMVWAAISWYSILFVPLLLFMAELLQGNTWTGWVIRCISWSRNYFRTMTHSSKKTIPPFI
jgi:hypothetical protein